MDDELIKALAVEMREYVDGRLKDIPTGPVGPKGDAGNPGPQGERGPEGIAGRDGRDALPMPGPQGERGEKGIDGRDGKDGKDGITIEHLKAAVTEMRAELRAEIVKSIRFSGRQWSIDGEVIATVPVPVYRGVFQSDQQYEAGDLATFGGSVWHCNNATTEKPGTNGNWTLAVKAGRDGRDRAK